MAAVLALVARVLGSVLEVLSVVLGLHDLLFGNQGVAALYALEQVDAQQDAETHSAVLSSTFGNAAIYSSLSALRNQPTHNYTLGDVLAALSPVTLPTTPPTGYGGATGSQVWQTADPNSAAGAARYGDEIIHADSLAIAAGRIWAFPHRYAPWFLVATEWPDYRYNPGISQYPSPDFADIRATDNPYTWLSRTAADYSWDYDQYTGMWHGIQIAGSGLWKADFYLNMSPAEFESWKAVAAPTVLVPPVWPGLSGVTLGSPVTLADALTVTGPLHGVVVNLTSAPPGAGDWPLGSTHLYYNWGEVAFESDRGDLEPFQFLGARNGVYLPKQMVAASAAVFRVNRLPSGTVTPFTIP